MTLRRLPAAFVLAVVVAMLAHVAGVGFDHAPGAAHAAVLLGTLGLSVLLALVMAFFGGAFFAGRHSIATTDWDRYTPLWLAGGGFAAFALIESLEGHLALGGALRALAAVLPLALGVACAARRVSAAARRAGAEFASYARARLVREPSRFVVLTSRACLRAARTYGRDVARGRAPPLFA